MFMAGISGIIPGIASRAAIGGGGGAISFVGGKTFTHTSASSQACSLLDLKDEAGNNATLAEGDIVIVTVSRTSTSNLGALYPVAPSTGYVSVGGDLYANDTQDANGGVAYKVMGASPDTSVQIPQTGDSGCAAAIIALRGIDTSNPLDAAATAATGTNSSDANPPAITPVTAGAWISVHGAYPATGAKALPADLSATTNHWQSAGVSGSQFASGVSTGLKTNWVSGAFDPAAWDDTDNSDLSWVAVSIAWRPA